MTGRVVQAGEIAWFDHSEFAGVRVRKGCKWCASFPRPEARIARGHQCNSPSH